MNTLRRLSQILCTCLYNAYLYGFFAGTIYQGYLKFIPCPGFNCHSCPGAIFVCPIGCIQLFAAHGTYFLSLYILGFLTVIGALAGRIICGWACPFGFLQELLYKVPVRKIEFPRALEKLRYVVLFGIVFLAAAYTKEPAFCKYICPVGTLEAGIPLMGLNPDLRMFAGFIFYVKIILLAVLLVIMVFIQRPFCRILCPLGAIYGFFNYISFYRLSVDKQRCSGDTRCVRVCPVSHRIYEESPNASRCIRCLRCKTACPEKAIETGVGRKKETEKAKEKNV